MVGRARFIVAAALWAALIGAGCKQAVDENTPPGAPERNPGALRATRRAQSYAFRHPHDVPAQLEAGKQSYALGQYNDAYAAFQRALTADPQNYEAIVGMARTNLKLLNPTQGLDWVGRARQLKPTDVELVELEARLYLLNGETDKSIAGFRRATALQPDKPGTWLNLAAAYAIVRKYPQAVRAAQEAVALAPNSTAAHFALARFADKSGDKKTAEGEYRAAIKLDVNNAPAMVALVRLLVDDDRNLDEARQLAVKASQVQADRPDAAVLGAWILHLQGEDKKSVDEFVKVVNAMPQNPEGWQKLAIVLRGLGEKEQADKAQAMADRFLAQSRPPEMDLIEGR